jgi:protein-S-isoprenylcysteine O-methyltransferase Ste14
MNLPVPPVWFFGCLVAMESLHVIAPGPRWTLVGEGVALHGWETRAFRRADTTTDLESRPTALVCVGPYRWSRSPMYLAGVPILVGVVLLLGLIALASILFLYCTVAGRWVDREEGALRECFGGEWDSYRGTVRRWI